MGIDLADYDKLAKTAVRHFWNTRKGASEKQQLSGKADQGERAGVTAGKNLDGFVDMVSKVVIANGIPSSSIMLQKKVLTLPGYFRPTKSWDLIVMHDEILVAVVEFKSQVGPSFGNNFNNRAEEVIGNAHDLWVAFREKAFGEQTQPFLGWLMLVEDCEKSQQPVTNPEPHFPVFEEFKGASYMKRYDLLCEKLILENLYTSACLMASRRTDIKTGNYTSMSSTTSLRSFVSKLAGHVAAHVSMTKP